MALRYSTALRNARANLLPTVAGASPLFRYYTGSAPASCAAAATGTLLAELTLPSAWLAAAASGVAAQNGVWTTAAALATGTPGYFRIYDAAGVTCHIQGTVPDEITGSPTAVITSGSPVTVTGYTFTEANA